MAIFSLNIAYMGYFSNAVRDNVLNKIFPLGLRQPVELLIHLPLIKQMTKRHEPNFILRPTEQGRAIENQSVKQLLVIYPTTAFFEGSSSDSTLRFVPLNIASMMLFL